MDYRISLVWPAHRFEEAMHAIETRLHPEGDVTVEIGEGFEVVHERGKAPGG
jgi:hypothetical protein